MQIRLWGLLIMCACLVFRSETISAAEISGEILGPNGEPLGGARVYLQDTLRGTVSDRDGSFVLADIPPGEYLLQVMQFGLATASRPVTVTEGKRQSLSISLGPNPHWLKAAAAYVPPAPERLAQKRDYLAAVPTAADGAPNVIVIFFDDLGYGDLSSYGNALIETPEIDRVAKTGVKLTEFYSSSPVCTPSRAGLLTGRYPVRAHAANHVFFPEGSPVALFRKVQGYPNALVQDEILLPEILAAAGYRTGMIGKWHLGDRDGHLPNDFGFESFYGVHFSNDMAPLHIYRQKQIEVPADQVDQTKLTALYTQEAVTFLEQTDRRPFFLYLAHTFPHVPHYADAAFEGRSAAGLYGDVVEDLDRSVGMVMQALEQQGLGDNTLVIVTSDNGGDYLGSVGPLRGRKGETFEGGMRVPGIFSWPERLPKGATLDGMAMNIDILPTVLGVAEIDPPTDRAIDGRNLLPMISERKASPHEHLFYFSAWHGRLEAVRDSRFKYRLRTQKQASQILYPLPLSAFTPFANPMLTDLQRGREAHDLQGRYPKKTRDLKATIEAMNESLTENPRGWID